MLKLIKNEREHLEKQLTKIQRELDVLPSGKMRCTSSNGSDQYFIDGKYLSKKKKDYAQKVAQQEYDIKLVSILKPIIEKWKELEHIYENQMLTYQFDKMCEARKRIVVPWFEPVSEKVQKFTVQTYEPATFEEDDKTEFFTLKNERVRSKSEMIIADELYRYKIPYHYEKPLTFDVWGHDITFRPDFTVMNPRTGKIFLLEHLGMMDYPEYIERNIQKLDIYERNGYLLGKNLLITHETSKVPLSRGIINSYMELYLL